MKLNVQFSLLQHYVIYTASQELYYNEMYERQMLINVKLLKWEEGVVKIDSHFKFNHN